MAMIEFIFKWDEDGAGMIGILKDLPLIDHEGNIIEHSSLVMEDLKWCGWEMFLPDSLEPGLYLWKGDHVTIESYDEVEGVYEMHELIKLSEGLKNEN